MKMIGKTAHTGPGGQNCHCCGLSKKHRTRQKRNLKRAERQLFKKTLQVA